MASIYELTEQYIQLENLLLLAPDSEEIQNAFEQIKDDVKTKADNYAKMIRNLESDIEGLKEEEKRIKARKESKKRVIENLKANLMWSMKQTGETKFKTQLFSFSVAKNGGLAPLKLNKSVDELPEEFVKIEKKADTDALRKYIEEYGDFTYAEIEERGEHVNIK